MQPDGDGVHVALCDHVCHLAVCARTAPAVLWKGKHIELFFHAINLNTTHRKVKKIGCKSSVNYLIKTLTFLYHMFSEIVS